MSFVRALGGLLAVALIISACSADDPIEATLPPSDTALSPDTVLSRETMASETLPFDDVLVELFGTTNTEAYLIDTDQRAAELVVECMNDAGFDFQIRPVTPTLEPPDPTSLEAAREQGFGIIAGYRYQLSHTDLASLQADDPNLAYLSTLPSAEIERFFFTLDGAEAEPGQRQEGGCNVTASDQAYTEWNRFLEALSNYTVLGEERDTHPDWVAARSDWRSCMIERGFDYAEPDALRTDVISQMRTTVNEVYPGGQVPVVRGADGFVVDPALDALLDELVQFERGAAVANVECTQPLADRFDAAERLVQQEFVDRHREAIDALLAASK